MTDTQCPVANTLLTNDLSTDYLSLFPNVHHVFVGLTQHKATHIVMMAAAETHGIYVATAQQQSKTTAFLATDIPHSPTLSVR
jgi:hypothetical protein